MLSAIAASTGGGGTRTTPSAASASVKLCAAVNAVTVFQRRRQDGVSNTSPSTKARWSNPVKMCSMPSSR